MRRSYLSEGVRPLPGVSDIARRATAEVAGVDNPCIRTFWYVLPFGYALLVGEDIHTCGFGTKSPPRQRLR